MAARDYVKTSGARRRNGIATVYWCSLCPSNKAFMVKVPKGVPNAGRGYGWATSSLARTEVINHIKAAHPDALKKKKEVSDG